MTIKIEKNKKDKTKTKKKTEFSKALLIQESILIWILSLSFIGISVYCIYNQFIGDLAWLATAYALPWAAYGISQAFYYKKAEKENTKGGIKYDSVINTATDIAGTVTEIVSEEINQKLTVQ